MKQDAKRVWVLAIGTTIVIGAGFAFFTTEVINVAINSGKWWFYLIFCLLLIVLTVGSASIHLKDTKSIILFVILMILLTSALIYLGLTHEPFDASNLELKLGLKNIFSS